MKTLTPTTKILFVCLGNICRSPSAEGIMLQMAEQSGMSGQLLIDSAGLISNHQGSPADARMRAHASRRGYMLNSISRPVSAADFDKFDLIIGMDSDNIRGLHARAQNAMQRDKIRSMCSFAQNMDYTEVPDPYYGGDEGFELVLDILEDACAGLIKYLQSNDSTDTQPAS